MIRTKESNRRAQPETPPDFSYQSVVMLRDDDGTVGVDYNTPTVKDFLATHHYKRDFCYGDILAIAEVQQHCIGFSHWSTPSGAPDSSWANPVWKWEKDYIIIQRFRVGQKGILKPV